MTQNDLTPAEQARLAAAIDTNQAAKAALEERQQTAEARATALLIERLKANGGRP